MELRCEQGNELLKLILLRFELLLETTQCNTSPRTDHVEAEMIHAGNEIYALKSTDSLILNKKCRSWGKKPTGVIYL